MSRKDVRYRISSNQLAEMRLLLTAAVDRQAVIPAKYRAPANQLAIAATPKQLRYMYDYYVRGLTMQDIAHGHGRHASAVSRGIDRGRYKAECILRSQAGGQAG